jgi:WhiB family transcriptional regulator, redox-sensing transcriptional regulator
MPLRPSDWRPIVASNQEWQELAECRTIPVEMFFPPAEQEGDEAKSICQTCSVKDPCLEFAISAGERFGIWGGLTPQERRSLVAKRRSRAAAAARAAAEGLTGDGGADIGINIGSVRARPAATYRA